MIETFDIAGYTRISVDDELDQNNISIENQKAIIEDFVKQKFPGSTLTFYEDRDRSGYTFEQREGYQAMRKGLVAHQYDILIVKDFSRFSRRNSRGLVELEDLRDAGVRIISIGDSIDFPNDDDWLKIQFQFLINEMPVTDTSKKVTQRHQAAAGRREVDLRRPLRLHHQPAARVRDRPHRGGYRPHHLPPLQRGGLGLQEDRQLPHRPGHPHPSHGGAGSEGGRRGGVQSDGEAGLGHCDGPGHSGQRLLHRHPAPGKIHPEEDQRQGHAPGRGRADRHRKPPPGHHRLPHLRHHPGTTGKAHHLPLPGGEEVRQCVLRLSGVRGLRQPPCSP